MTNRPTSPPPTIRAVLFDLDGTLVATRRLYLESYRRALSPILGRDLTDEEILAHRPRSEGGFLRSLAGTDADACVERFHGHYRELHATHFEGVYPGVPELLAELRRRALPIGIVTGKSRRAWEVTEAVCRLGPFGVTVLDDDVTAAKPDPQGLRLAVSALGLEAMETVYVGDTMGDVLAAKAAGALPAAALWAWSAERRSVFERSAAEAGARLLASPGDLLDLL